MGDILFKPVDLDLEVPSKFLKILDYLQSVSNSLGC